MGISAQILFYISAVLAVLGGLMMLFARNTVNSAMGLLLTFVSTSGIYLSISYPFIAMAQIFLYSGAVAVLIVFAILLIDEGKKYELPVQGILLKILSVISVGYIGYILSVIFNFSDAKGVFISELNKLGRIVLNDYILHIEALSIILVISIMAAILIAKRKTE